MFLSPDLKAGRQGEIAELLVRARLMSLNLNILNCGDATLPYDVAVDYHGRVIRVQVKSTKRLEKHRRQYTFQHHCTKYTAGSTNHRSEYSPGDYDVLCVVALDTGNMHFMPHQNKTTLRIHRDLFNEEAELKSWQSVLNDLQLV